MKKFTDQDAADLVQAAVDIAKTTTTDDGGAKPEPPIETAPQA